jgi:DNA-binding XRE family transcriptional regulator
MEARGSATQSEFAEQLGVNRSCLSRYEQEKLGAPVGVINKCLQIVSARIDAPENTSGVQRALMHVRHAATALELEIGRRPLKKEDAQRSKKAPQKR